MSNMSYCRFQNTLSDLRDCQDALEGLTCVDPEISKLSREEFMAARSLVEVCVDIVRLVAEESLHDVDCLDAFNIADALTAVLRRSDAVEE